MQYIRCLAIAILLVAATGCGESGGAGGGPTTFDPITFDPIALNSARLSWEKPTTNQDGSPVIDLAGYQIYYSETSPVTPNNSLSIAVLDPNQISYTVVNLAPGTYYFAVTAVNLEGTESSMSNEAVKTIFPTTTTS